MEIHMDQVISLGHSTVGNTEEREKKVPIVFEAGVLVWVENSRFTSYLSVEAEVGSSDR